MKLKKWVVNLLILATMFMIMMLGSDCQEFFLTSKIICMITIFINITILKRYSDLFEEVI